VIEGATQTPESRGSAGTSGPVNQNGAEWVQDNAVGSNFLA
jgi:hypothetical protein